MSKFVRYYEHTDEVVEISMYEIEEEVLEVEEDDQQEIDEVSATLRLAKKQASEILAKAKEQAKKTVDDANALALAVQKKYLEEAQIKINELEDQALRDGYNQGFMRKSDELTDAVQTIHREMKASINFLKQQNEHVVKQQEEQLKFLAIEIASKILRKKCEEDSMALDALVDEALTMTKKSKRIHIDLPDNAKQLMLDLEEEFREQPMYKGRNMSADIREMPSGTVYVESDMGLYDLSVDTQLENLKKLFVEFE